MTTLQHLLRYDIPLNGLTDRSLDFIVEMWDEFNRNMAATWHQVSNLQEMKQSSFGAKMYIEYHLLHAKFSYKLMFMLVVS